MKPTTVLVVLSMVACFAGLYLAAEPPSPELEEANKLKRAMREADSVEKKLELLDAFSKLSSVDALKRVEWYMYQDDVSEAACRAVVALATKVANKHPNDAAIALKQALRQAKSEDVKHDARRALTGLGIDPQAYLREDDPAADPSLKRVVFVAGPMDHAGPGAHEYAKDHGNPGFFIEHASTRTVVCRNVRPSRDFSNYRHTSGDSNTKLFLENVGHMLSEGCVFDNTCWARWIDTETAKEVEFLNTGGRLWVLDYKCEDSAIDFRTIKGGATEVLGGIINQYRSRDGRLQRNPAFELGSGV